MVAFQTLKFNFPKMGEGNIISLPIRGEIGNCPKPDFIRLQFGKPVKELKKSIKALRFISADSSAGWAVKLRTRPESGHGRLVHCKLGGAVAADKPWFWLKNHKHILQISRTA